MAKKINNKEEENLEVVIEPMFLIELDVTLMTEVFLNIIEEIFSSILFPLDSNTGYFLLSAIIVVVNIAITSGRSKK